MDAEYYKSYEDLKVHKLMLSDSERVKVYKDAITSSQLLFKNSIVLDVGAGSGILSVIAAQAGAKKVYAVEAALCMIPIIKKLAEENQQSETIEVIGGEIESIDLPEKVDIIISEWMGFYLLHESMINSVIYSKKFLKEGGLMFPEKCSLFVALCELPQYFDVWNNVQGVKMVSFGEALRKSTMTTPDICYVNKNSLITNPTKLFSFKLLEAVQNDFNYITGRHVLPANRAGKYQGVCIWFDVEFPSSEGNIVFSTSPFSPKTHWKQTVVVLPSEINVEEHDPLAFEFTLSKYETRKYKITFFMLESDEVEHPSPCDCNLIRCRVIKAYLSETADNPT